LILGKIITIVATRGPASKEREEGREGWAGERKGEGKGEELLPGAETGWTPLG